MREEIGSPRFGAAAHLAAGSPLADSAEGELFATIDRSTLSSQACSQIRDRIVHGRLAPATRVAEASLAEQLGISRTPLHEAMLMLAHEGLVEPLGRKGWLVAPLTASVAQELYPVLARIETLALETIGNPGTYVLGGLRQLIARSEREEDSEKHNALERQWHGQLIGQCPNSTVVELATSLVTRVFRYEIAYVRQSSQRLPSRLTGVSVALEMGDVSDAHRLVEMHWKDRSTTVIAAMGERSPVSRI